jgi:hypothetical protein
MPKRTTYDGAIMPHVRDLSAEEAGQEGVKAVTMVLPEVGEMHEFLLTAKAAEELKKGLDGGARIEVASEMPPFPPPGSPAQA